jgi:hypothetical protein
MSNNIEAKVVATTPRTMRKSRRSAARFKLMSVGTGSPACFGGTRKSQRPSVRLGWGNARPEFVPHCGRSNLSDLNTRQQ